MKLQDKIDRAYPRYYDFDLEITKDQWLELLKDKEIFHEKNIEHLKCMYSFENHAATCKEVSKLIGGNASTYVGLATNLAKRIAKKLDIESLPAREGDSDVYWYILFYGQETSDNERGSFEWKLRPELAAALKELYPELEYPHPIIEKKIEDVHTAVWLATALLTYKSYKNSENVEETKIVFEAKEIKQMAEKICSKNIHNPRIAQWCNGDHPGHSYRYLRAEKTLRRLTAPGEFGGEKERPDQMNLDLEFELDGEPVTVETLVQFVDEVYSELIYKEIDLEAIVRFLFTRAGEEYRAPENAGDQAEYMKQLQEEGTTARQHFIKLGERVVSAFPNYEMGRCSGWIDQAQKVPDYLWIEFKKKGHLDHKSSVSLFAWKYGDDVIFYTAVEARDSACKKEDYDKHNKLIYKEKQESELFYRVFRKDGNQVVGQPREEVIKQLENNELIKIRLENVIGGPYANSLTSILVSQIRSSMRTLEPYYNLTIGEGEEGVSNTSTLVDETNFDSDVRQDFSLNSILYGPPGTGKTYHTVLRSVAICDQVSLESLNKKEYKDVLSRFDVLKKEGRIAFTTFHQSYGYEEFIEGIKPVIRQQNDIPSTEIQYEYASGVFKKFCEAAKKVKVQTSSSLILRENPTVWNVLLGGAGQNKLKRECFDKGYIKIGWSKADEVITDESENLNSIEKRMLLYFQDEMQEGDIVFIQRTNTSIDAIGIVSGPYEFDKTETHYPRTRKVEWIKTEINEDIYSLNKNTKLGRNSVYPLRNVDIKDVINLIEKYSLTTDISVEENVKPYVFIIDEINRGNISKIFGELITLIEPTKRLGSTEPSTATLPYTGEPFGVPNNVYILGTMNTADRSIALMDTALRRRFQFVEMMPDTSVLTKLGIGTVEGIDIVRMLNSMNERIEYLFDREHTIGHAYFTSLSRDPSLKNLAGIFLNAIIPLLQEYFYEDYSKIQLVLGDNDKTDRAYKFILDEEVKHVFKGNPDIDLPEKKYTIQKNAFITAESYIQIYQ
jgi:hypothetical protein